MQEQALVVSNADNHEFELATLIVRQASEFKSHIQLVVGDKQVNAKSIMGVTYLALTDGDKVTVHCEGSDEEEALTSMTTLLAGKE